MSSVRILSRILLMIEAFLLLIPSFWGLFLVTFCLFESFGSHSQKVNENLPCLVAFLSFCSFWYLFVFIMAGQMEKGKKINNAIVVITFVSFVLSISLQF